ncbi:MAG: hypothetical protein Ct9H300mP25_03470 [Acidobacteriota bacterium]|nr:MAG: hypothetical protein Ct9H300mP25_03470 [Acidobacteriota bacterium]
MILSETRSDAAKVRDDLRQQAQNEAQSIVQNAERQIQLETDRAVLQIRKKTVELSLSIASKLIRRNLTKEDNQTLIDEAFKTSRITPSSVDGRYKHIRLVGQTSGRIVSFFSYLFTQLFSSWFFASTKL